MRIGIHTDVCNFGRVQEEDRIYSARSGDNLHNLVAVIICLYAVIDEVLFDLPGAIDGFEKAVSESQL
jgi:hypothetical protein